MTCEAIKPRARHSWHESHRDRFKTEKICTHPLCRLVKVTRHEPAANPSAWLELWCDGERIADDRYTPPCPYPAPNVISPASAQDDSTATSLPENSLVNPSNTRNPQAGTR